MALNKTNLAQAIKTALDAVSDTEVNPAAAREQLAQAVANAVDLYVRAGEVNVLVTTTGTAAAQSGTGKGAMT